MCNKTCIPNYTKRILTIPYSYWGVLHAKRQGAIMAISSMAGIIPCNSVDFATSQRTTSKSISLRDSDICQEKSCRDSGFYKQREQIHVEHKNLMHCGSQDGKIQLAHKPFYQGTKGYITFVGQHVSKTSVECLSISSSVPMPPVVINL